MMQTATNTRNRVKHHEMDGGRGPTKPWGAQQVESALQKGGLHVDDMLVKAVERGASADQIDLMRQIGGDFRTKAQLLIVRHLIHDPVIQAQLDMLEERLAAGEELPIIYGTSGCEMNAKEVIQTQGFVRKHQHPGTIGLYFIDTNSHPLLGNVEAEADQLAWTSGAGEFAHARAEFFEVLSRLYTSGANGEGSLNCTGDMLPAPTPTAIREFANMTNVSDHVANVMYRASAILYADMNSLPTVGDWKIVVQGALNLHAEFMANGVDACPVVNSSWTIVEDFSIKMLQREHGTEGKVFTLMEYVAMLTHYFPVPQDGKMRLWNYPDAELGELHVCVENGAFAGSLRFSITGNAGELGAITVDTDSEEVLSEEGDNGYPLMVSNIVFSENGVAQLQGNNGGKGYYAHMLNLSQHINIGFLLDDYEKPDAYLPVIDAINNETLGGMIPIPMGRVWVVPENQEYRTAKGQNPDSTLGSALATWILHSHISPEEWGIMTASSAMPIPGETHVLTVGNDLYKYEANNLGTAGYMPAEIIKLIDDFANAGERVESIQLNSAIYLFAGRVLGGLASVSKDEKGVIQKWEADMAAKFVNSEIESIVYRNFSRMFDFTEGKPNAEDGDTEESQLKAAEAEPVSEILTFSVVCEKMANLLQITDQAVIKFLSHAYLIGYVQDLIRPSELQQDELYSKKQLGEVSEEDYQVQIEALRAARLQILQQVFEDSSQVEPKKVNKYIAAKYREAYNREGAIHTFALCLNTILYSEI